MNLKETVYKYALTHIELEFIEEVLAEIEEMFCSEKQKEIYRTSLMAIFFPQAVTRFQDDTLTSDEWVDLTNAPIMYKDRYDAYLVYRQKIDQAQKEYDKVTRVYFFRKKDRNGAQD